MERPKNDKNKGKNKKYRTNRLHWNQKLMLFDLLNRNRFGPRLSFELFTSRNRTRRRNKKDKTGSQRVANRILEDESDERKMKQGLQRNLQVLIESLKD